MDKKHIEEKGVKKKSNVSSKYRSVSSKYRSVSSKCRSVSSKCRNVSSKYRSVSSKCRSVSSKCRSVFERTNKRFKQAKTKKSNAPQSVRYSNKQHFTFVKLCHIHAIRQQAFNKASAHRKA